MSDKVFQSLQGLSICMRKEIHRTLYAPPNESDKAIQKNIICFIDARVNEDDVYAIHFQREWR